jgi:hypothetical protein
MIASNFSACKVDHALGLMWGGGFDASPSIAAFDATGIVRASVLLLLGTPVVVNLTQHS